MMVKIACFEGFDDPDANGFEDVFASHWTDEAIYHYVNANHGDMDEVREHLVITDTFVCGAFCQ